MLINAKRFAKKRGFTVMDCHMGGNTLYWWGVFSLVTSHLLNNLHSWMQLTKEPYLLGYCDFLRPKYVHCREKLPCSSMRPQKNSLPRAPSTSVSQDFSRSGNKESLHRLKSFSSNDQEYSIIIIVVFIIIIIIICCLTESICWDRLQNTTTWIVSSVPLPCFLEALCDVALLVDTSDILMLFLLFVECRFQENNWCCCFHECITISLSSTEKKLYEYNISIASASTFCCILA